MRLVLVKRGDKRQLVFNALEATKVIGRRISSELKSHPGKSICLSGETRQHDHGMEQMLALGDASKGVELLFEDGFVHIAGSLF